MDMTPTQLLHRAAGGPAVAGEIDCQERCALCGDICHKALSTDKALGVGYAEWGLLRFKASSVICSACTWSMQGKPPATLRMWSILYRQGWTRPEQDERAMDLGTEVHLSNRGNTRPILDTLLSPPDSPWFASIAQSGQKHVVPFVGMNSGSGTWTVRIEATDVTSTPDEFRSVLGAVAALRDEGHSADSITAMQPSMAALKTREALDLWRTHEETLRPYTRSPLVVLANHLITKETSHDYRTA